MSKILVIGDACIDEFNYCGCSRLCPEAPVPVLDVQSKIDTLGMAGNVWRNLMDLGADADKICNDNYLINRKTRYVDAKTNHMFVRIDSPAEYPRISNETLSNIVWEDYAAVVISDYDKGFLKENDILEISKMHPLTFLDTKKKLGEWAANISFIKINRNEYELTKHTLTPDISSKIIETLGDGGCSYDGNHYEVKKVEVKDLSGAGDSFLAALVKTYVDTKDIKKSLVFANEVATIVVQKMGISTVND